FMIGVRKGTLQFDRPGGHVHGVIHEREGAGLFAARVVLRTRAHRQFTHVHVALDRRQLGFRNRKRDVNRLHLVDGHQIHAVGHHHVALLYREVAGTSVYGRADFGVAQLHARVVDRGFTGPDRGLDTLDGGFVRGHRLRYGIGVGAPLLRLILGDDAAFE